MTYDELHRRSLADPEGFWAEEAESVLWRKRWTRPLDSAAAPFYRWFPGGELNTCENAVDRHVADGFGDQPALICDSPMTDSRRVFTYAQLQKEVALLAGGLARKGVQKGDRVVIYMPMVPEAVFAMLACARLGAVHSVVFGGFSAKELAARIDDAQAKFVLSASCGLEPNRVVEYKPMLDGALKAASHQAAGCAILQRDAHSCQLVPGRDMEWGELTAGAPADCVPVDAADPLYILYTSGTTGKPKGIVRDNGGHAVALKWTMPNIYDSKPGEVYWAASDIGWVVGHSYIVYAPLLNRNATILYEGKPVGTPDAGAFWRVVREHKVSTMFTAPTALRAIKKDDPDGKMVGDLGGLRALFLAGERCDPDSVEWAERHLKVPVIDHWWQTETGWAIAANPLGLERFPVKLGSATKPMPGYDLRALDEEGGDMPAGELGHLAVKLPLPPGTFPAIWRDEARCRAGYYARYPGFYLTGDSGMVDSDGYAHVMSRVDDVINVAAHRLSTGAMEEALCAHPDVAEAAVFGVQDDFKGQLPLGLAVLNSGRSRPDAEVAGELIAKVREDVGPVASFKLAAIVKRLPKTRSGKILRATMRKMANGEAVEVPATIDDPAILPEIKEALAGLGYPKGMEK